MIRNSEFDEWVRNKALRQAFVPWIAELRPWTFFGTLEPCPGYPLNSHQFRALLRYWDAKVCRSLLGSRWQRVANRDARPFTVVFFEGGPKSHALHAHMLVYTPPELKWRYWFEAGWQWGQIAQNRICNRDLQLAQIGETKVDRLLTASYATKNLAAPQHMESWQFLP